MCERKLFMSDHVSMVLFCRIKEDISQDDVYGIRLVPPCPNKRPYYFVVPTENERKVLLTISIQR